MHVAVHVLSKQLQQGEVPIPYHVLFALLSLYNRCHLMYGTLGSGRTNLLDDASCSDWRVDGFYGLEASTWSLHA